MKKNYTYCFNKETKIWTSYSIDKNFLEFLLTGDYFDKYSKSIKNIFIENASNSLSTDDGKYVFCDKDFNILDITDYIQDLKELRKYIKQYPTEYRYYYHSYMSDMKDNYIYGEKLISKRYVNKNCEYAYRKEPVPFTGKRVKLRQACPKKYRYIIKYLYNPEHKEFNRKGKYTNLLNYLWDWDYCGYTVSRDKTWKNKKVKHQWEKNLK